MPQTEVFDLYYLLVEKVFGSILGSMLGMSIVIILYGFLMRMSPMLIFFILASFIMVFSIGYAGALGAVVFFLIGFAYFGFNLISLLRRFM